MAVGEFFRESNPRVTFHDPAGVLDFALVVRRVAASASVAVAWLTWKVATSMGTGPIMCVLTFRSFL